jgi:hypothetical protein
VLKRYAVILALLILPNIPSLADAENEVLTLVCQVVSTDITGSSRWKLTLHVNYTRRTVVVWGGSSAEYPAKIDVAQIGWTQNDAASVGSFSVSRVTGQFYGRSQYTGRSLGNISVQGMCEKARAKF